MMTEQKANYFVPLSFQNFNFTPTTKKRVAASHRPRLPAYKRENRRTLAGSPDPPTRVIIMERENLPPAVPIDLLSSDESSDGDVEEVNDGVDGLQLTYGTVNLDARALSFEDLLSRRAQMYQEYMKQIPIPQNRGSVIPFNSWVGLGKSVKKLYVQPLHYLTNICLKQWDRLRIGSEDENVPLDTLVHPSKAEATIWLVEEIHRQTSSHHEITRLWLSDPSYHSDVDSIFPLI